MSAPPTAPWHRQLAAALRSDMILKGVGTTVFITLFFVAYFYVLRHSGSVPTLMPLIGLDRWLSFQPAALPLYLSLWVYVSLLPAIFSSRAELFRYAAAMTLMCALGLFIFYVWPTAAPVPDIDWRRYPDLEFLKGIDATGNACPSLHVATAFFSAIWFHHLLRRMRAPGWLLLLAWIWCAAIVYSTVAIKQHVAVDAIAGLALGGFSAWMSIRAIHWRRASP